MNNEIQTFTNDELNASVRTVVDEGTGNTMFCAKDVAVALGYMNHNDAIKRHCRGVVKRYPIVDSLGRAQEAAFIAEPDMYRLITGSKLPSAQRFEAWVFEDVLPSIRRTGHYGTSAEAHMERLLTDGAALIEAQKAVIENMRPRAAFAEAVEASETLHSVGECAKVIGQAGVKMGQKRLFDLLRKDGWLMKSGKDRNLPTQRAREMDLIRIEMSHYVDGDGANCTKGTPRITGKGMTYFFRVYGLGRSQMALPMAVGK